MNQFFSLTNGCGRDFRLEFCVHLSTGIESSTGNKNKVKNTGVN